MEEQKFVLKERNIEVGKNGLPTIKIIIAAVAAIVIVAIICIIAFSSPLPNDYKELRKNLRDAGFEVETETDKDEALDFYADFISNLLYYDDEDLEDEADTLVENIEDNSDATILKDIRKSVNCAVMAVDEDEENFIVALYFDESKSAKELYKTFKPVLKFIKENGSDSYVFEEIKREDFTFGQKGKIVYIATKDALDLCK